MNQRMYGLGSRRSVIREIFEFGKKRAQEVGAENVYDFSLGNPSVNPPQIVTDTLEQLLREEDPTALHGYTSAQGDASVRAAIADYIRKTHGVAADADYIYMTCGAAASLTISLSAICVPRRRGHHFRSLFYRVQGIYRNGRGDARRARLRPGYLPDRSEGFGRGDQRKDGRRPRQFAQ